MNINELDPEAITDIREICNAHGISFILAAIIQESREHTVTDSPLDRQTIEHLRSILVLWQNAEGTRYQFNM